MGIKIFNINKRESSVFWGKLSFYSFIIVILFYILIIFLFKKRYNFPVWIGIFLSILIICGLIISNRFHSWRYQLIKFISRFGFIFISFFITYIFITKKLNENSGRIDVPSWIFQSSPLEIFDWIPIFLIFILISLFAIHAYLLYLEDYANKFRK